MNDISIESLERDLRSAMVSKDAVLLRTLRSIKAAFQSLEIEKGRGTLTKEDLDAILQKQAKQRREAMAQFESAGRTDLYSKEQEELAVIETYLPKQLTALELDNIVADAVDATGAESMKDMGRVMGVVMPQVKGKADGNLVRQAVTRLIGQR